MADNTELKRLAESVPQLPWSYETNGFILAWDGTERSRCENVGGFHYVCEGVSNFREYLLALEPSKILALIAENNRIKARLCVCRDCGGQGEVYSGHSSYQGHYQPPEPDMDVCGTCGGDGVLGPIEDFEALAAERDQLRAENAGLQTGYKAYEQVNAELRAENERLHKVAAELREWTSCNHLHHEPHEQHADDVFCKVLARIDAALGQGEQP